MSAPAPTPSLLPILPTRVRRNYRGGLQLDRFAGVNPAQDSDKPESWIASTLTASNPGLPQEAGEGLTRILVNGNASTLRAALETAPEFYLGAAHVGRHGPHLGFLAKLLDSSMRLHVQAHPTSAFAREHLNAPYGKLEVYYVLAVRPGCEGYIRLGFQRSPGREKWREIIACQDIPSMDACFDKIPVKPGEVWIVPGGMPHAIGEGVLMVEVMEPSDLVVRCEFEREGVVLPPNSRFMGRDLDFCLQIFDYGSASVADIRKRCQLRATNLFNEQGWAYDQLVNASHTSCFEIFRLRAGRTGRLPADNRGTLVIQTSGSGRLEVHGQQHLLKAGDSCFVAAAAGAHVDYAPLSESAEILLCRPSHPEPQVRQ